VVKGVASGPADLSETAVGQPDAGGPEVHAKATDDFNLTGPGLAITLATNPPELKLAVNDKGEVKPGKVTVMVTFTNTTKATVKGVRLLLLSPEPVVKSQQLDQLGLPSSALPLSVGDFPAGSKATRKFDLSVTGDGKYQWRALALYNDPSRPGGNGRASAVGGEFEAVVPLLYFDASVQADLGQEAGSVTAGRNWYVGGEVNDLSSYQTLCVAPLVANTVGNAVATGLQEVSSKNATVPSADGVAATLPFAGALKPKQSFPLGMFVATSPDAGTSGRVNVEVHAYQAGPGASCELQDDGSMSGMGAALTDEETDITAGSTSYSVRVDPPPRQAFPTGGLVNYFGAYAKSTFDLLPDTFRGLGAAAKYYALHPVELYSTLEGNQAFDYMTAGARLVAAYLIHATPAQSQGAYDFVLKTFSTAEHNAHSRRIGIARRQGPRAGRRPG
jgi:hypothetical protein